MNTDELKTQRDNLRNALIRLLNAMDVEMWHRHAYRKASEIADESYLLDEFHKWDRAQLELDAARREARLLAARTDRESA